MAVRRRGFGSLAWASVQDLFDQGTAFGRLALVHVLMMAGDTMVTVMIGGLRTVMNGDFEVFTGDLIQWYVVMS